MKHLYLCLLLALGTGTQAQVAINNTGSMPDGSSMLDVSSTSRGLLAPRMTLAQRNQIASPATGLLVYQTTSPAGFYFNSGTPASPVWVYQNPGDNWGGQVIITDATLTGNGLAGTPLKLAQQGAIAGQTLKWNGTAWAPGNDSAGLTLPYDDTISILDHAFAVTNSQFNAIAGFSLGTTGVMTGVRGEANSASGRGVMGLANSTTGGSAMGVGGYCMSGNGYGVFALNYGPAGNAIGLKAESLSPTGISVFAINNQGTGQHAVIRSESNSPQGIGVYSIVTATSGASIAVRGSTQSTEGTGVLGRATATSGFNYGVYGASLSPTGYGVYGKNESSTAGATGIFGQSVAPQGIGVAGHSGYSDGNTTGVKGSVVSSSGVGVMGESLSGTSGLGVYGVSVGTLGTGIMGQGDIGVVGVSSSAIRYGVWGTNNAITGLAIGVFGNTASSTGIAVLGNAITTTGINTGVKGQTSSNEGTGVYGSATSATGTTYAVQGVNMSPDGVAVFGQNKGTTGGAVGVWGSSLSVEGYGVYGAGATGVSGHAISVNGSGVYGDNSFSTGPGIGVQGYSNSSSGIGVRGTSGYTGVKGESPNIGVWGASTSSSSANGFGVYGTSESTTGKGVWGSCSATTGTNYGVYGAVLSPAGYAGYFDGRLFANGRTGIRTQTPGAGLHLVGSGFPESFIFLETGAGQDAGFRIYEGATAKWHMFNNSALAGLQIYNSAGTTAIFMKQTNSYVGIGTTNPTYKLHVDGEAAKTTGTTAWVISSDERLKDIHGQYTKGLKEIEALQPILFNYKSGNIRNLPSNNEYSGLSAQQVQQAFPEAVSTGPDGYLDFNMHSVNIALINAVKELNARIAQLEKELRLLKDARK